MSRAVLARARAELAAQLRIAVPVVTIQIGLLAMGFVDGAFLGRVSSVHYAAVTLGHTYTFTLICVAMGILTAFDPILSQAWGARDHEAIRLGYQRALVLALVLSVPVAAAFLPSEAVLRALGQPAEVIPLARGYCVASATSVAPFLVFVALRQGLQAMHRLRPMVLAILGANLLNAGLDWVLIYGHWGVPPLGAIGSAWATVLARWALAAAALGLAWPELAPYLRRPAPRALALAPLVACLRLGLPIGVSFGIEVGTFGMVAMLMGRFGAVSIAGHSVALQLASLSFMVPLGISMAVSVRVGNAVGAGDSTGVRRAAAVALGLGILVMAVSGGLFLSFPRALGRILTDLPEVLQLAAILLPLAGLFQVFDGVQAVAVGILRGVADTRWPMLFHLFGFWLVGLPLGVGLAYGRGLGPAGLWWGLVVGLGTVAVVQLLRVRSRLAGPIRRVVIDRPEPPEGGSVRSR